MAPLVLRLPDSRKMAHGSGSSIVQPLASSFLSCGRSLTIHSSRRRKAARLNSGVRFLTRSAVELETQGIHMENKLGNERSLVFSYLALRKAIGLLAIAFPFVVSLGALILFQTGIQSSVSSCYHTGMRDVFVGTLCAIGFFLLSYKGYERSDDIAGAKRCGLAQTTLCDSPYLESLLLSPPWCRWALTSQAGPGQA